jgi:hypothetical protein
MNPISTIETLITEPGSSAILNAHLSLAKERFSMLESQVAEYQVKTAKLLLELEIERAKHNEVKQQLQRLKDVDAEDIRVHRLVEFRCGIRTGGKWMAFCPKCHSPAGDMVENGSPKAFCTAGCGWSAFVDATLRVMNLELNASRV